MSESWENVDVSDETTQSTSKLSLAAASAPEWKPSSATTFVPGKGLVSKTTPEVPQDSAKNESSVLSSSSDAAEQQQQQPLAEEKVTPGLSEEEKKELQAMLESGDITKKDYEDALQEAINGPSEVDEKVEEVKQEEAPKETTKKKKEVKELKVHDERPHINVVFIGHVDAGKSTISGQILFQSGQVDKRQIDKLQKEAGERGRDSWFLAYIMDTNEQERAKGKTVELGMAHFDTKDRRFTLLDAPGHKTYVPNMIGGAQQADIAVLVISARKGEFEAGFMRGGQSREHAMLAYTLGIKKLIILVNKMDDKTVQWQQKRFDEIKNTLGPFLRKEVGFKVKRDCVWIPASGLTGENILKRLDDNKAKWHKDRRSLLDVLNEIQISNREPDASLVMPIMERYSERGTWIMGKVERGTLKVDHTYRVLPNNMKIKLDEIVIKEQSVEMARVGENVRVRAKCTEQDVQKGFVLIEDEDTTGEMTIGVCKSFEAQIFVTELLSHRPLMSAGYNAVMHIHNAVEDIVIKKLIAQWDNKNKKWTPSPRFLKNKSRAKVRIKMSEACCLSTFNELQALGRFTIRDEEKTIAIGMIERLPKRKSGSKSK